MTRADPNRKRSAGIIVLRRIPEGWRLLLLRAFRNWDFPKGLIAVGEDPLAAALREAREETGLTDRAFSWGYVFRETEPYAGGKIARFYMAQTRTERIVLPNRAPRVALDELRRGARAPRAAIAVHRRLVGIRGEACRLMKIRHSAVRPMRMR